MRNRVGVDHFRSHLLFDGSCQWPLDSNAIPQMVMIWCFSKAAIKFVEELNG